MENKITTLAVTATVGIVLVAFMVGVLTTYGGEDKEVSNTGLSVALQDADADYSIVMDANGDVTINGESSDLDNIYWLSESVYVGYESSTVILRHYIESNFTNLSYTPGTDTFSFTVTDGTIAVDANGSTLTTPTSYEWAYAYDENGEYVYTTTSSTAYISSTDELVAYSVGERYVYNYGDLYFMGELSTGATYDWVTTDTDHSEVKILGLSTVTLNDDSRQLPLLILPKEIPYHIGGTLDSYAGLIYTIPVLVIAAILLMFVYAAIAKRD